MALVAVAGWHQHTNPLVSQQTELCHFDEHSLWPSLCEGDEVLRRLHGHHVPLNGAVNALKFLQHSVEPVLWCATDHAGSISETAFETIVDKLLTHLDAMAQLEGVYLDLGGAMAAEHLDDAIGDMLGRLRAALGAHIPIVASLSLHANITTDMVEHADAIEVCRHYPHADYGAAGARAVTLLNQRLLAPGQPWFGALRKPGYSVPIQWSSTRHTPCNALYKELAALCRDDVDSVSLSLGYGTRCGPAIVAYGSDRDAVTDAADTMLMLFEAAQPSFEAEFAATVVDIDQAIDKARRFVHAARWPVVLSDSEDGADGGSLCKRTALLKAVMTAGFRGAVFACFNDADAVDRAFDTGINKTLTLSLGGDGQNPSGEARDIVAGDQGGQRSLFEIDPIDATFRVVALSDGAFTGEGELYGGRPLRVGRLAVLEFLTVKIVVSSKPVRILDPALLSHLGIVAEKQPVLVLKSAVDYRVDFDKLASESFAVRGGGLAPATSESLPRQLPPVAHADSRNDTAVVDGSGPGDGVGSGSAA